jgi:hypothetical protein
MSRNGRELFAKLYISLMDHPKVLARSELAFAAFIRALLYARVQHSGFIPSVAASVIVRGGDAAHREAVLTELSTEQQGTGAMLEPVWEEPYVLAGTKPKLVGWHIRDWEEDNGMRTRPLSGADNHADMSADSPADIGADTSADNADMSAPESPADRRRRLDRERKRKKRQALKQGVKPTAPKAQGDASEAPAGPADGADIPADNHADMSADSPADSRADGEKTREDKRRQEKGREEASARTRTRRPAPSRDKDGVISGVAANRVVQAFDAEWARVYGKPLGLSERHNAHYSRAADVVAVAEKMATQGEHWEDWVARALVAAVPKLKARKRPWWDFCETPAMWLEHSARRGRSSSGGMFPASSAEEHKRDAAQQKLPDWMTGAAE